MVLAAWQDFFAFTIVTQKFKPIRAKRQSRRLQTGTHLGDRLSRYGITQDMIRQGLLDFLV